MVHCPSKPNPSPSSLSGSAAERIRSELSGLFNRALLLEFNIHLACVSKSSKNATCPMAVTEHDRYLQHRPSKRDLDRLACSLRRGPSRAMACSAFLCASCLTYIWRTLGSAHAASCSPFPRPGITLGSATLVGGASAKICQLRLGIPARSIRVRAGLKE